ncbi:hypothetical protein [Paenibacillus sp. MBLB4367]|uniref:hypothetical protein n=1 Tax=Paenibacillus sp. MBLB4367 TaxID=3384767 RepID=UPI00390811A1
MRKKIVSTIIAGALAVVPMAAFAANYSVSYEMKAYVNGKDNGQTYAATAGNITVEVQTSTQYRVNQPSTYSQTLMRTGFFSDTAIGSVSPQINGYDSNTWSNLSGGTYYLVCSKQNDGALLTASGTFYN